MSRILTDTDSRAHEVTVPSEFWTEVAAMATAGGLVAAVAVPVGWLAWRVARRQGRSLLPRPEPWRVPWTGFELAFLFALVALIPSAVAAGGVRPLAVGLVALPLQLALLIVARRVLCPRWTPFRTGASYPGTVAVAVLAWAVLTPLVLALNAAVTAAFTMLDLPLDEHPITKLGGGDAADRLLFVVQACVAAPVIEELLFRWLLLPWAIGARERHAGGPPAVAIVPPAARPWLVTGIAVAYAAASGRPGPVIFAGVLAAGLVVLWVTVRHGRRHVRGVYATAAFFALIHSEVWPSPIPLFLLGLGLGWLAVRTRGVLAPILVHGLFNAVSVVFVLRGTG